jgi:HD-GYP domain-containing protein (c-di-GMP phosphodiesterase class II)
MGIYCIAITSIFILIGVWIWTRFWSYRGRISALQTALENNQKLLDHQSSQTNIFITALPNLQTLVLDPHVSDSWKSSCLDAARAMVRADGGSFWRFIERDQELVQELAQGDELPVKKKLARGDMAGHEVGQAALQKASIISQQSTDFSQSHTVIALPLLVTGNLWGVFRLVLFGQGKVSSREAELLKVFFREVGLILENREMINNRERFYLELVQTLADILDSKDASKEGQTRQARQLAREIGKELDMPEEFIYYLEFAALMHDIGKIAIDESILKKPGKLTAEEFEIIKKHPELGYKILSPVSMLAPVAPMVLYHQEWFNGQGYPEGLRGEEIPLGARIVAVLDAWGSMTTDKTWRKALSVDQAVKEINKGSGTQFDPKVVDAFIEVIGRRGLLKG